MARKKLSFKSGDAQIKQRVASARPNPSAPKRRHESAISGARQAANVTLTAIRKAVNAPVGFTQVEVFDALGQPTGKFATVPVKPDRALRQKRRDEFVFSGLLSPLPSDTDRRKTRRRNNRHAAVGTKGSRPPKKTWHRAGGKKADEPATPKKKKKAA